MKHIKIFETFTEEDSYEAWEAVQSYLDVAQLYELLLFKYGSIFTDTKQALDDNEDDYNPDEIYETIEYELKRNNIWNDFLQNYLEYENEKEEADPWHWKHNKIAMDKLMKGLDDIDF